MNSLALTLVASCGMVYADFGSYYRDPALREPRRLDYEDDISGKFADIVVEFDNNRKFVFGRQSSYLPYWQTEKGKWYVDEGPRFAGAQGPRFAGAQGPRFAGAQIVPRSGDDPRGRPDKINRYSYVRIIEGSHPGGSQSSPNRVVVHWRYMPDFTNVDWDGIVDEYFTITPDGKVVRTIKKGTEKIDDWNDPSNVITQTLKLQAGGMGPRFAGTQAGFVNTSQLKGDPALRELRDPALREPKAPRAPVAGSPVKTGVVGSPVAYWKFDEAVGDNAKESVSNENCTIGGHKSLWKKGISGTALEFDGYYSAVTLPASGAFSVSTNLTVEAWIALGAYPFGWAPIVHQSDWGNSGYYLGIDKNGCPGFHASIGGSWQSVGPHPVGTLTHSTHLDLFRWYHIAATFDKHTGKISLYVDGEQVCSKEVSNNRISTANKELMVGLNSRKMPPISGRIRKGKWPSLFGIDGLIDEVKIYNATLSPSEVSLSYNTFKPSSSLRDNPDMDERHLPANPQNRPAEKFGAEYMKLSYYETWDNMWRVSDHPDVVVKFDESPVRIVFWRGLSYGVGLVTENGKWGGDQSSENYREIEAPGEAEGCCEHMSDKQCRHSHVRIIENTDARVVIHWRYGLVDSRYIFVTDKSECGDWADEYWTIYPDGVGVRYLARGKIWDDSWVETMFYSEPGTMPEDNVELEAYTLVNMNGQSKTYSWENGSPDCNLPNPIISMINMKSTYKPFNIYPTGSSVETFPGRTKPSHFHWWNHFPVSQITSDGRSARASDRAAHSSLVWGNPAKDYLMYGLTNKSATSLIPLAKSWNSPPSLTNITGCSSQGYKPEQRAYVLTANPVRGDPALREPKRRAGDPALREPTSNGANASILSFTLKGSKASPIVNPCFVINGWGRNPALREPRDPPHQLVVSSTKNDRAKLFWCWAIGAGEPKENVKIKIDGKEIGRGGFPPGGVPKNFRYGHRRGPDGMDLIVWIKKESKEPISVELLVNEN